jgi:hypothetical protein
MGKSMGTKIRVSLPLLVVAALTSQPLWADAQDRAQAKRIHDRLTGVSASNATIDAMEALLISDDTGKTAAEYAIDTALNPNARYFYNVTLKNFAAPWTNEEQTVFTPLNDYSATVVGLIRDGGDFRQILHGDIIYRGELEDLGPIAGDLSNPNILEGTETQPAITQSSVTGLPSGATAGIMTTRAGAEAFYSAGTNRAMFRFTLMNHLCTDLEPLKDVSRTPDKVRRDVSRSPGGDSRLYQNGCVACHAGMDGMAGAFARYEWDSANGRMLYNAIGNPLFDANGVSLKHNINPNNFEYGYITTDDSWINYWRNGPNSKLGVRPTDPPNTDGWGPLLNPDPNNNETGNGAKSLGVELANSKAFAQCQVDKTFKAICLRDPNVFAADRNARDGFVTNFVGSGYDMREVFTDVAAYCKGS